MIRRDNKADTFQRQIAALREQLGSGGQRDDETFDDAEPMQPDDMPAILSAAGPRQVYAPPTPVTPSSVPRLDAAVGIVAANARWNGTLTSNGSLHVYGIAEGELVANGDIYVAEGARVEARIQATNAYVAGLVIGTIECMQRLEVLPSGHVSGDVTTATLVVHDGALVSGNLHMRGEDSAPSLER